jgi:hypothetical protein
MGFANEAYLKFNLVNRNFHPPDGIEKIFASFFWLLLALAGGAFVKLEAQTPFPHQPPAKFFRAARWQGCATVVDVSRPGCIWATS